MKHRGLAFCAAIGAIFVAVPEAALALPACADLATNPTYGLAGNPDKRSHRGTTAHERVDHAVLQGGFRILGRVRPVGGIPARSKPAPHHSGRLAAEQRRHDEPDCCRRRALEQ